MIDTIEYTKNRAVDLTGTGQIEPAFDVIRIIAQIDGYTCRVWIDVNFYADGHAFGKDARYRIVGA